jgi:ATP-dependent DNA helicase DinG
VVAAQCENELSFGEAEDELARIADWALTSKSGGRDDLSFTPTEKLWSRVCSDADLCMGKHCHQQQRCFVQTLRKEANAARIIVVNHHLLFADLAARHEGAGYESAVVLPPYSRVIIDEAHTIEDAATSFFSKEFGRAGIMRHVGRLYRRRRAGRTGLLVRFCSLLSADDKCLDSLVEALDGIRLAATELDSPALDFCGTEGVFRFSPEEERKDIKTPCCPTGQPSSVSSVSSVVFPLLSSLSKKLLAFTAMVRDLIEQLPQDALDDSGGITSCYWELKAILRRFESIAGICTAFTDYRQRPGEVMWIERRGAGGDDAQSAEGAPSTEGGRYWAVFTQIGRAHV